MKTRKVYITLTIEALIISGFIAGMLFLQGCSAGSGIAKVTINTGVRNHTISERHNESIISKILAGLDFFTTKAYAGPAPLNIVSIYLSVTGPGMESMGSDVPLDTGSITVEVPAGSDRTFSITAVVDPLDTGTVVSFGGSAVVSLSPGEDRAISIAMGVKEAKIIVPDYLNARLVQIDDMSGAGWTATNFGITTSFSPWKVDMDSSGRVYIANKNTSQSRVIRVNNINDSSPYLGFAAPSTIYGVEMLTVDRRNSLVYYMITNTMYVQELRRANLDGANDTTVPLPVSNYISDIAADDNGMLYILSGSDYYSVIRINPANGSVISVYDDDTYQTSHLFGATGLLVKAPYVYAANPQNFTIVQFTSNLQFVQERGAAAPNPPVTQPLEFYGPRQFATVPGSRITIMDDDGFQNDRLASMDDINGAGWSAFGSWGTGVNQFRLYAGC